MIRYLKNGEIDRKKWDACVKNSRQKLIYAYSWYLDLVSESWDGLVEDDYQAVMALPVRKKWGMHYVYQPFYTQQLGIYSSSIPDKEKSTEFIRAIPALFRYVHYNFNFLQDLGGSDLNLSRRVNYELRLNHPYEECSKAYSDNTRRNISKALTLEIRENPGVAEMVKLKRVNAGQKRTPGFYEWINCLMEGIISRGNGFLVGAWFGDELVAAAFFMICSGRIYYLIPVSNEAGKSHRAMFSILDYVIGKYADTGLILDFEGSGIKGIARFFAGFGARPVYYHSMKLNRLPFYMKFLKK